MITSTRLKETSERESSRFRAIANAHRFAILMLLAKEDMRLFELSEKLELPGPLLIHHLKLLQQTGWTERYSIGSKRFFRLKKDTNTEKIKVLFDF